MKKTRVVHRKMNNSYFWRDAENRYILAHREDGYLLISDGLKGRGYHRSPAAVRMHAERSLGLHLSKFPKGGMRLCVSCGTYYARPSTVCGRAGFCPTCWRKRQAAAMREGRSELEAEREYQREKKRRRDERHEKEDE